jgi:hypothetical protein
METKATIHQAKRTISKYNSKPAIRLDLTTPLGIKSKTVNVGSRDYINLIRTLQTTDLERWKGQNLEVDLRPSKKKSDWFDVFIRSFNETR